MFLDLCYALLLAAVSPVLLRRALFNGKYRDHLAERLGALPRRAGARRCVWIHAVSLGEMRAARTLAAALQSALPDWDIVFSTATETGRAEAERLYGPRRVFYYPLDFSACVAGALDAVRPDLVVLMELEFWPNFTRECRRRGIPLVLANGRITERSSRRYGWGGRIIRDMFNRAGRLCVQTEVYAERFRRLGVDPARIVVVPNLKYDTADFSDTVPGADALAAAVGIGPDDRPVVGGSTGPGEEQALLDAYRALKGRLPRLRLAIVPRRPERFDEVAALIERAGLPLVRRSRSPDGAAPPTGAVDAVILGDTMGELRKFYALSRAAFLGRSLIPAGGSDMTEAAALGKPTVFGPHTRNFEDTVDCLLAVEGAVRIAGAAELTPALERLLSDEAGARETGRRAAAALRARRGGTERTVREILEVIGPSAAAVSAGRPSPPPAGSAEC
jgi:3-deoxy-D-manno-octulosonic-acid transferase